MKKTYQLLKRSYVHPVVIIDDLFSYQIHENDIDHMIDKWLDCIDLMLNDTCLIETWFRCESIDCHDVMVELHMMFDKSRIKDDLKKAYHASPRLGLLKPYDLQLKRIIKQYDNKLINPMVLTQLADQWIVHAKRVMLDACIKDFYHPVFISLRYFDYRLLYRLHEKILGFMITGQQISAFDSMMADAYQIPVFDDSREIYEIESDLKRPPHYHASELNIYVSLSDIRGLSDIHSDWYKGIIYHSEYMMIASGMMMPEADILHVFETLFVTAKNKPIYLEIPNFTDHKRLAADKMLRTEVNQFSMSHPGLKHWVNALEKAMRKHQPNITFIIPNINSKQDTLFWQTEMDILKSHLKHKDIHIGMAIETETALQYCEDFETYQTVLIKLDQLMIEYDIKLVNDIKDCMDVIDDLKEAHYVYRVKQPTPHILSGKMISHQTIFRKFINMGFRHFAVQPNMLHHVAPVIREWEKTRGKFAKKDLPRVNIIEK